MAYRLTALIGDRRVLAEVAAELPAAQAVELGAGMSLLPLTTPVLEQVPTGPPGNRPLRGSIRSCPAWLAWRRDAQGSGRCCTRRPRPMAVPDRRRSSPGGTGRCGRGPC